MRVAFRTDASNKIGTGHFMRCLTLADRFRRSGVQVDFLCSNLPMHFSQLLEGRGINLFQLEKAPDLHVAGDLAHSDWLEGGQTLDANASIYAVGMQKYDWMVVDHYALDYRWEGLLRPFARKIMVIDDLADRLHDCDLLLDQNYYINLDIRYAGKVPNNCLLLLGPKYALLRDEFTNFRKNIRHRSGAIKKILVFFGGVDVVNCTGMVIDILVKLNFQFSVDVVIGASHPKIDQIKNICSTHGFMCYVQTSNMAQLMAEADLAIGAPGSATWERCCLGLPSLLISIADNQIDIAKSLEEKELCFYAGSIQSDTSLVIEGMMRRILDDSSKVSAISLNGLNLVDGSGAARVAREMGLK